MLLYLIWLYSKMYIFTESIILLEGVNTFNHIMFTCKAAREQLVGVAQVNYYSMCVWKEFQTNSD